MSKAKGIHLALPGKQRRGVKQFLNMDLNDNRCVLGKNYVPRNDLHPHSYHEAHQGTI